MDLELFKKMYKNGAKYKEMKKEFGGISFSTINAIRVRLGLPKREKSFDRFDVDEELFLKLYNSREPYYTYEEISSKLGCCTSLIVIIRRRLNLPDRAPKPRLDLDEVKFRQMYLDGISHDQLCDEFGICIDTIRRLKKKFNLPSRKKQSTYEKEAFIAAYNTGLSNHALSTMFSMERKTVSLRIAELGLPSRKPVSAYNEAEFVKAHASGMSIVALAEKFKISKNTVLWHIQELRLSSRVNKKTTGVELLMEHSEPVRSDKKNKTKESIRGKVTAPVKPAEVPEAQSTKTMISTFKMPPKTLREIQKMQLQQEVKRAERQYKITHKENGFGSLLGKEIDDQIVTPFTK